MSALFASMRMRSHVAFLAMAMAMTVLLAVVLFAPAARAETLQELAAKATPSVVLLTAFDAGGRKLGTGTGFFVSPDGTVATNHHVIAKASKVTASLSDGRKLDATGILADDEDKDLALIKVPGAGFPALLLGESSTLRAGDDVVVIGSPMGLSGTLSAGIISAIRKERLPLDDDDDHSRKRGPADQAEKNHFESWGIQVSAAISPGSSGSPIMRPNGEVVAVAVGRLVGGESLNFGIPIADLKTLIGRAGPDKKPEPFAPAAATGDVRRNLAISAGFFAVLALLYFILRRSDAPKPKPRPRASN